ncbi:nitroreductase family protein [Parasphaerochaeta coccoides]|uniref:Nitroreductase n=1 Tax=Parasphaerochaeta coccoides (strain ATCC BAA-1237 / DSM 17374 / SPN1) TaxID=760011 RepID=F4GL54_PARC1|nr:nitroreductase family protein [Parasphaerochaeta coccoides]AEC02394.1 nitroreductase [Parasphaerochaeta coccoides DSM 17374]
MEVQEAILTRRSCRSFADLPVERGLLDKIMDAAVHAPSAMNIQPWHFTVITDRKKLDALDTLVSPDNSFFYRAPVLVIASLDSSAEYGVEDSSCALQNIMLAAHGLGLGSVWCNRLNRLRGDAQIIERLRDFGVPADKVPHGAVAIGHPGKGASLHPRVMKQGTVTWVE